MKNLIITWSISRARDTYGYNVVTLRDGDKKFKACGGGYDMLGTAFASWLWHNHREEIINKIKDKQSEFYGFYNREERYWIDGACGLDCMVKIAKEIGLKIERLCTRKGQVTNFVISKGE